MIATRLTEKFDIAHPIVCAPMALVTGGALAAAVTHAGGLGILGGGYAGATGPEPDLQREYRAAGNAPIGVGFITWAAQQNRDLVAWVLDQNPRCLFLSFGDPSDFGRQARDRDTPVICQVQTLEQAKIAVDVGADVIVAQGTEAGGHGASRSTFPFVPEVVDLVSTRAPDVLVLAAGGIADGRGLAAALALGADGVVVGTRFWASKEALTPDAMVARAVAGSGDDTTRSTVIDQLRGVDWPSDFSFRTMRNALTDEWDGRQADANFVYGSMKDSYLEARANGDLETVATVAGEGIGLIKDRLPAAQIIDEMVEQAETVLKKSYQKITQQKRQ